MEIEEDIYWTDAALDDHIPLYVYDKKTKQPHMRSDVHKWATITKTVTGAEAYYFDWQTVKDDEGKEHYKFWCKTAIRYDGPNVEFSWQLMGEKDDTFYSS